LIVDRQFSAGVVARTGIAAPVIFLRRRSAMMEGLFQPMHLIVIAGIALLFFGPKKLPELGKGLGESIRGFKAAMAAKEEAPVPAKSGRDGEGR
jgi:sec-independent protein translocase protein TatA